MNNIYAGVTPELVGELHRQLNDESDETFYTKGADKLQLLCDEVPSLDTMITFASIMSSGDARSSQVATFCVAFELGFLAARRLAEQTEAAA